MNGLIRTSLIAGIVAAAAHAAGQGIAPAPGPAPARAAPAPAEPADKEAERPVVEVVFVLDTTGSMSGLIEGAKRAELRERIVELSAKRAEYVRAELKRLAGPADSFDRRVLESLRRQAERIGVDYAKDDG